MLNKKKLHIAGVLNDVMHDSPGLSCSIYIQGCRHACKGCHNPHTWSESEKEGEWLSVNELMDIIKKYPISKYTTITGGDPMFYPEMIYELVLELEKIGKKIVIFTGFTLEELMDRNDPITNNILSKVYMIIDGKYIEDLKDPDLYLRGSSNQNIYYKDDIEERLKCLNE